MAVILEGEKALYGVRALSMGIPTLGPGVYVYQTADEVLYVGMARSGVGARALAPKHAQEHIRAVAREILVLPCRSVVEATKLKASLLAVHKPIYNQRGVQLTQRHRQGMSTVCLQCQTAAQIDKWTSPPFCDNATCSRRGHRLDIAPLPVGATLSAQFCEGCGHRFMATLGAALTCANEGCRRLRMPLTHVLSRAKGARR